MNIEYEATFSNIDKDDIRERLKNTGASLVKKEFLMKRMVFTLPKGNEINGGWLRIRDEGEKTTLTLKIVDGDKIEDQKEIELEIDSFETAGNLLHSIGCNKKGRQETMREIWELDGVEIMIDEWPFLEPFVEVEGKNEKDVRAVSEKLGFDYNKALFCAVSRLYSYKYGMTEDYFNNWVGDIAFESENPFNNL